MSSPSLALGRAPASNAFSAFLSVTERFRRKEKAILLLNMATILTTATAEIC